MIVKYAILADYVTVDVVGKASITGIFHELFTPQVPVVHREMVMFSMLEGTMKDEGGHKLQIEIRDPDDEKIGEFEQVIHMKHLGTEDGILRAQVITKMRDLRFGKTGEYEFVIFEQSKFLYRIVFTVRKVTVKGRGEE